MQTRSSPFLTLPDVLVLRNLYHDVDEAAIKPTKGEVETTADDQSTIEQLKDLNDAGNKGFQPTIFTGWDQKGIPKTIDRYLVQPYANWAKNVVRRPTDVVFLTHILLYLFTSVPSAVLLYYRFSWYHAAVHWLLQAWYCGSFTLMLHNHIHNSGILAPNYAWLDRT